MSKQKLNSEAVAHRTSVHWSEVVQTCMEGGARNCGLNFPLLSYAGMLCMGLEILAHFFVFQIFMDFFLIVLCLVNTLLFLILSEKSFQRMTDLGTLRTYSDQGRK